MSTFSSCVPAARASVQMCRTTVPARSTVAPCSTSSCDSTNLQHQRASVQYQRAVPACSTSVQ
eukprot:1824315-Rhodomonas_salina.1